MNTCTMTIKPCLKTILPLAAVAMFASAPAAQAELVTHYKLDEASGGTIAIDATGNGNDGTMASTTSVPGSPDPTSTSAISMDSPNLLSGVSGLAPTDTSFTIMFWLQSSNFTDGFNRFFSIGNDTASQSEAIFAYEPPDDKAEVVYYPLVPDGGGESSPIEIFDVTFITTAWHHHAAVVDGLTLTWYVDGTLRGSGDIPMGETLTQTEFFILGSPSQISDGISGSIDEVGVFDTALSQEEIAGFMDNGLTGGSPGSPPFAITEIDYAPDAEPNPTVTLSWNAQAGAIYTVYYSRDPGNLQEGESGDGDVEDSYEDNDAGGVDLDPEEGKITIEFANPDPDSSDLFFSVHKNN